MVEAPLSVSIVTRREEFQALEELWNRLLAESSGNTFFLRWEWLWAWWESFGASLGTLHILLVKRGERVVGIGPFYWTETKQAGLFPIRRLLFLGTASGGGGDVGSEYLDLIVHRHHQEEALATMSAHLLQEGQFHEWMLLHVPAQAPILAALLAQAERPDIDWRRCIDGSAPTSHFLHDGSNFWNRSGARCDTSFERISANCKSMGLTRSGRPAPLQNSSTICKHSRRSTKRGGKAEV